MNIGLHHYLSTTKEGEEVLALVENKRVRALVNSAVYIFGAVGILVTIPQITNIWFDKNTAGVSLITWTGFFLASIFWTFYGIIHKAKPIILLNLIISLLNLIIIIGILLYGR